MVRGRHRIVEISTPAHVTRIASFLYIIVLLPQIVMSTCVHYILLVRDVIGVTDGFFILSENTSILCCRIVLINHVLNEIPLRARTRSIELINKTSHGTRAEGISSLPGIPNTKL